LSKPLECREAILFNKPKAVINAAAYTAVDNAESDEYLAGQINGEAVSMMAKTCAELKIPLVHISTDYVFDGSGTTPWLTSDIPNPINAYGRSKLQGERAIEGVRMHLCNITNILGRLCSWKQLCKNNAAIVREET
jgi:dTDP-4-dehydrorhamnose reductase